MIIKTIEMNSREKLSEILNALGSCYHDPAHFILSALHRILPDEDFDIHVWHEEGYEHLDDSEMIISKLEELFHNSFDVHTRYCTMFAPCEYNIDNPYNRIVLENSMHTNWITMEDYSEDDSFAVRLVEDFCEGLLCVATAVYDANQECSPQIIIPCSQIEKLMFDEALLHFELRMPNGDIICKEDISKVSICLWEKKRDYFLTKQ